PPPSRASTSPRVGDSVRVSRGIDQAAAPPSAEGPTGTTGALAKPPVRKLAKELGIDLGAVTGSGPNGVIPRDDVRLGGEAGTNGTAEAPPASGTGGERRVPIKGVRKAT